MPITTTGLQYTSNGSPFVVQGAKGSGTITIKAKIKDMDYSTLYEFEEEVFKIIDMSPCEILVELTGDAGYEYSGWLKPLEGDTPPVLVQRWFSKTAVTNTNLTFSEIILLSSNYTVMFDIVTEVGFTGTGYIFDNNSTTARGYCYYDGANLSTNLVGATTTVDGVETLAVPADGKIHSVVMTGVSTGQGIQRFGSNYAGGGGFLGHIANISIDNDGDVYTFAVDQEVGTDTEESNSITMTYNNVTEREYFTLSEDETQWDGAEGTTIGIPA